MLKSLRMSRRPIPPTQLPVRAFGKTVATTRSVDGFSDSLDGSIFRIRFMPPSPGDYSYSLTHRYGDFEKTYQGSFQAIEGHRRRLIRVDPKFPWHFVWEGTGEHYFFNGATAVWRTGWREDRITDNTIQRLDDLKIIRLRVLLQGAMDNTLGEPVIAGPNFTMMLQPWIAESRKSFGLPGFDYTRFNVVPAAAPTSGQTPAGAGSMDAETTQW